VKFSSTYGWTDGTVYEQNAPPRLCGRGGPSIHRSSKNRRVIWPAVEENSW